MMSKEMIKNLIAAIRNEGIKSQNHMDSLCKNGATMKEFHYAGLRLEAFGKCYSRLYKKYIKTGNLV
jgi:hypothetical protein